MSWIIINYSTELILFSQQRTIFTYNKGVMSSNEPYVGRLNMVELPHARYDIVSVNLTSIRESDNGWFQCKVTFPNRTPSRRNRNGTWFHLSVNGEIWHFFVLIKIYTKLIQ